MKKLILLTFFSLFTIVAAKCQMADSLKMHLISNILVHEYRFKAESIHREIIKLHVDDKVKNREKIDALIVSIIILEDEADSLLRFIGSKRRSEIVLDIKQKY